MIWIFCVVGNDQWRYDMSGDGVTNDDPDNDDMSRDGMPSSYEKQYGVVNGGWQHPYLYNARYAVLLASGDFEEDRNYPAFWNDIKYLYDVLVDDYNYLEENVHLLYSVWGDEDQDHSDGCEAVDDEASRDGLKSAIESVEQNMTVNDFLVIALTGHGSNDGRMQLQRESEYYELLEYSKLNEFLQNISYNRMAMMIWACYSGTAIPQLEGENRIVMTSSEAGEPSYTTVGSDGKSSAFLYEGRHYYTPWNYHSYDGLVKRLGSINEPHHLWRAWYAGYWACRNNYSSLFGIINYDGRSTPQISDEYLALFTYI